MNTDYILWHLQLIVDVQSSLTLKPRIYSFLTFMLINFLWCTLKCTETLTLIFRYESINKKIESTK